MKIGDCRGIIEFGNWMSELGYRVGEGPGKYGPVSPPPAHVVGSLHYRGLAYDVNYGVTGPEEHEQLTTLYHKILRHKKNHPDFPLDEMFHNGLGYIKELGVDVNHPISNHDDHLHVGFWKKRPWT